MSDDLERRIAALEAVRGLPAVYTLCVRGSDYADLSDDAVFARLQPEALQHPHIPREVLRFGDIDWAL